MSSTQEGEL